MFSRIAPKAMLLPMKKLKTQEREKQRHRIGGKPLCEDAPNAVRGGSSQRIMMIHAFIMQLAQEERKQLIEFASSSGRHDLDIMDASATFSGIRKVQACWELLNSRQKFETFDG